MALIRMSCTECSFAYDHWCPHFEDAASQQGALDGTRGGELRQTDLGDHDTLRALGIAVEVGTLVPSGAAVRLSVDDIARWLDPEEAHRLSIALRIAAEEAMHDDRAARRG